MRKLIDVNSIHYTCKALDKDSIIDPATVRIRREVHKPHRTAIMPIGGGGESQKFIEQFNGGGGGRGGGNVESKDYGGPASD